MKFGSRSRWGSCCSGGPSSVYDADAPKCDPKVLALSVPVLGICYGMQWMAHTLGGKVERADRREYGPAHLDIEKSSPLFKGFTERLKIWNSHGDHVAGLPDGFHVTGRTDNAVAAVEHPGKKFFAVEFHPEVNHTDRGTEILQNFIFDICGAKKNWDRAGFIAEMVEKIRQAIGWSARDLRVEWWSGFCGGCGAGSSCHWRQADERLRRYRLAAA